MMANVVIILMGELLGTEVPMIPAWILKIPLI